MANVHDYLRWRGDLTLAERPFNDVDNLVLAMLSYLELKGVVGGAGERPVLLSDACSSLLDAAHGDLSGYVMSHARIDCELLTLLMASARFGNVLMHDYVDEFDESRALQFAAVTLDLPDGHVYVSFRGTDSTIVGWHEDFMVSFTVAEAQHMAAAYLDRICLQAYWMEKRVLVGGHSKGGCLADYAARACPKWHDVIERVYSNDGPSMAPETLPQAWPQGRLPLRKFVPRFGVFGMIFEDVGSPPAVILSDGQGIGQHDPTTWQVNACGFERAEGLSHEAALIDRSVADWASSIPLEDRERVISQVFFAFESTGARTFADIASSADAMQKMAKALARTDDLVRESAFSLLEVVAAQTVRESRRWLRDVLGSYVPRLAPASDGHWDGHWG